MLKQINDQFYQYFDKDTKMLFSLKLGDRGVYGSGKSWYLTYIFDGQKNYVASFVIQDDGYKCYQKDTGGKLWKFSELFPAANEMIRKMLE